MNTDEAQMNTDACPARPSGAQIPYLCSSVGICVYPWSQIPLCLCASVVQGYKLFIRRLGYKVFSSASISAGWPTEVASSSRSMRRTRPESTLPAPISTMRVTPCSFI
jgi:hypothetical protein